MDFDINLYITEVNNQIKGNQKITVQHVLFKNKIKDNIRNDNLEEYIQIKDQIITNISSKHFYKKFKLQEIISLCCQFNSSNILNYIFNDESIDNDHKILFHRQIMKKCVIHDSLECLQLIHILNIYLENKYDYNGIHDLILKIFEQRNIEIFEYLVEFMLDNVTNMNSIRINTIILGLMNSFIEYKNFLKFFKIIKQYLLGGEWLNSFIDNYNYLFGQISRYYLNNYNILRNNIILDIIIHLSKLNNEYLNKNSLPYRDYLDINDDFYKHFLEFYKNDINKIKGILNINPDISDMDPGYLSNIIPKLTDELYDVFILYFDKETLYQSSLIHPEKFKPLFNHNNLDVFKNNLNKYGYLLIDNGILKSDLYYQFINNIIDENNSIDDDVCYQYFINTENQLPIRDYIISDPNYYLLRKLVSDINSPYFQSRRLPVTMKILLHPIIFKKIEELHCADLHKIINFYHDHYIISNNRINLTRDEKIELEYEILKYYTTRSCFSRELIIRDIINKSDFTLKCSTDTDEDVVTKVETILSDINHRTYNFSFIEYVTNKYLWNIYITTNLYQIHRNQAQRDQIHRDQAQRNHIISRYYSTLSDNSYQNFSLMSQNYLSYGNEFDMFTTTFAAADGYIYNQPTIYNDTESSIRSLSKEEQESLNLLKQKYGHLKTTFEDFKSEISYLYHQNPAMLDGIKLPLLTHGSVTLLLLEDQESTYKSYYQHTIHSIIRWISKPNHLLHSDAQYVYGPEGGKYSCFEDCQELVLLFWNAANDPTLTQEEQCLDCFYHTLFLVARSHNWDETKIVDGKKVEYDDLEGDKPSCYSGIRKRLFTSIPNHPCFKNCTINDQQAKINSFVHNYYKTYEEFQKYKDTIKITIDEYFILFDSTKEKQLLEYNIPDNQIANLIQQLDDDVKINKNSDIHLVEFYNLLF